MSEVQAAISRNVGVLRAVRGLRTDTAIAEILGCGISTVSKKMNGSRKWTIEEVETLAEYFRIQPGKLLGDPSDLLDPGDRLNRTAGGSIRTGTSAYVPAEWSAKVIPFPQVSAPGRELPVAATVIPFLRPGAYHTDHQPSLIAVGK